MPWVRLPMQSRGGPPAGGRGALRGEEMNERKAMTVERWIESHSDAIVLGIVLAVLMILWDQWRIERGDDAE